jgi:penicillin amidase
MPTTILSKQLYKLIPLILTVFSFSSIASADTFEFPGLAAPVQVYENIDGIATVVGENDNDIAFVTGWLHARDRFFQMDTLRRTAQGKLAELFGTPVVAQDGQLRAFGLDRAALRSYQKMGQAMKAQLVAYSNGINAFLAANPLPPEYTGLEITSVKPWSPLDSVAMAKLLAFQLSFDLDVDFTINLLTYQAVGNIVGFDGTALFTEDTHRSQPGDTRVTVPDHINNIGGFAAAADEEPTAAAGTKALSDLTQSLSTVSEDYLAMATRVKDKFKDIPIFANKFGGSDDRAGSNWWIISGEHTDSGYPILMNDPHLALNSPATWTEMSLVNSATDWSVSGVQFAGIPGIVLGCNNYLCWGATVHPMDVSDIFQEQFQTNFLGLPYYSVHASGPEPIQYIFQKFFVNIVGDGVDDNIVDAGVGLFNGGLTLSIPRRNNGPVIDIDSNAGNRAGLSLQYTGWSATQELEAFRGFNNAASMEEFVAALQFFDFGSQNFAYADVDGNIAYFAGAENPIRNDLQAGFPDGGIPPWIIRDGTGALNHEWAAVTNPQAAQSTPNEIMPFAEMPQVVNPASGYIANGNNDPVGVVSDNNALNQLRPGGGIYYLNPGYASGYRMGRIDRVIQDLIASGKPITLADMQALQANNQLLDAELLLPLVLPYMFAAPLPPGSPIETARSLLAAWDYSTPTGIIQAGYDPGDDPNNLPAPSQEEINASVAATIYATFRGQMIKNTIDALFSALQIPGNAPSSSLAFNALLHHLRQYPTAGGIGASGLPIISVPGITDPLEARRWAPCNKAWICWPLTNLHRLLAIHRT